MKKQLSFLLALLLALVLAVPMAVAEGFEEEEFVMEDLPEDVDLLWTFPVALSDMDPDFV